jgi:hypothetical protein
MAWTEARSATFAARFEEEDTADVAALLDQLETTHEQLGSAFGRVPEHVAIVVHGSNTQLSLAQPVLPIVRRLTAPAARRYLAGWYSADEVHVLAPRLLRRRASNVAGSEEMLLLTPAALYTQLVIGHLHPRLPPPFRPGALRTYSRWAWLVAGAGSWFSGQTALARPAIIRRLREGGKPAFPPSVSDAPLLGGTIYDLLVREEGEPAAVRLAHASLADGPRRVLERAFHERAAVHTEGTWRSHLTRMATSAGDR